MTVKISVWFYEGWDPANSRRKIRCFTSPAFRKGDFEAREKCVNQMAHEMKRQGFRPDRRDIVKVNEVPFEMPQIEWVLEIKR